MSATANARVVRGSALKKVELRLFYVRDNFESALLLCNQPRETQMRDAIIYKILRQSEWAELQLEERFGGSEHDKRDGFIHMSTKDQLQGTLDKHYTDGDVVILAAVRVEAVSDPIKWEVSRGGAEFPHIYGELPLVAVTQHWILSPDTKGRYDIAHIA